METDAVRQIKAAIEKMQADVGRQWDALAARVGAVEALANGVRGDVIASKRLGFGPMPGDLDKGGFDSLCELIQTLCHKRSDPRIEALETKAATALMSSEAAGGILVPDAWNFALVQHIATQTIVRSRARTIPSDQAHPEQTVMLPLLDYTVGRRGGVRVDWYSEGAAIHETDSAAWGHLELTPNEVGGIVTLSDKLLRNATALEQVLTAILGDAIGAAQDRAFFCGTGLFQPTGVQGHACSIEVARETPGHVTYTDVVNMEANGIPAGRFVWVISQTVKPELRKMTFPDGIQRVFIDAAGPLPASMLGYPVLTWEGAPILGSYADVGLCDFSYFALKDGINIRLDASQSVGDNFSKGLTSIRIRASVDGKPMLSQPWVLDDETTATSPFVFLGSEGGS